VALALLVAPTGLGRGTLLLLLEGPCPPDCMSMDDHDEVEQRRSRAATSSHLAAEEDDGAEHAHAWQAESEQDSPDCDDCSCCGPPTVAVFDFPILAFGMLEAFQIDWQVALGPVRKTAWPGLYRPPKPLPSRFISRLG